MANCTLQQYYSKIQFNRYDAYGSVVDGWNHAASPKQAVFMRLSAPAFN